jgi:predicted DNA binding protein
MVVVAEILVADSALPLVGLADSLPGGELTVSNSLVLGDGRFIVTVSFAAQAREVFERELERQPQVVEATEIGETVDGLCYQLVVEDDSELVAAHDPVEFEGVLIEAAVTGEGIRERKVFSDYDALQTLRDRFEVRDIPFELLNIASDPENVGERDQFGLTDKQYEAISVAFSRGYYESPRQFSTDELADELDVSAAAASDLLRRAEKQLLSETIGPDQYLNVISQ